MTDEHGSDPWWRIAEPSTTLTDVLLAIVSGWFAWQLLALRAVDSSSQLVLAGSLLAGSAAALLGAVYHGFSPRWPLRWGSTTWLLTLIFTGVVALLLQAAVVMAAFSGRAELAFLIGTLIEFGIYLERIRRRQDFGTAVIYSALSLLAVSLIAGGVLLFGSAASWPTWILGATGIALVGAIVQWRGLGIHQHMNHNDLFHLFQIGAVILIYRAGVLF